MIVRDLQIRSRRINVVTQISLLRLWRGASPPKDVKGRIFCRVPWTENSKEKRAEKLEQKHK